MTSVYSYTPVRGVWRAHQAASERRAVMAELHEASLQLLADIERKEEELRSRTMDLFDTELTAAMGSLAQVAFLEVQPATDGLDIRIITGCCKVFEALLPFGRTGPSAPSQWRQPLHNLRTQVEALLASLRAAEA